MRGLALSVGYAVAAFYHNQSLHIGLLDREVGAYLPDPYIVGAGHPTGGDLLALGNQFCSEVIPGYIDQDSNFGTFFVQHALCLPHKTCDDPGTEKIDTPGVHFVDQIFIEDVLPGQAYAETVQ
jgi:hypothetical protein